MRVYAGRDVVTGRKRWDTKTVRGGKREALRALAAMVAENDRGAGNYTNATVGELLEEWFALAGPGYSPKGARETRGVMDRNLLPFNGNVPTAQARRRRHRPFLSAPAREGRTGPRHPHGALVQGVKWGWLSANPASSATPPRIPMPDINPPAPMSWPGCSRWPPRSTSTWPTTSCWPPSTAPAAAS